MRHRIFCEPILLLLPQRGRRLRRTSQTTMAHANHTLATSSRGCDGPAREAGHQRFGRQPAPSRRPKAKKKIHSSGQRKNHKPRVRTARTITPVMTITGDTSQTASAGRVGRLTRGRPGRPLATFLAGPPLRRQSATFTSELWTVARITQLIAREFGVAYHPSHVWWLLRHRLGWSPQRPVRQAKERDQPAVQRWIDEDWPRIKQTHNGAEPA